MRIILFTLIISLLACTSNAQARKADSAGNRGNYLYLNGLISDMDIASGSEKPLPYSQIVIFQNNELYVSFYGGKDGSYSFFLPLGFEYEIRYGNSTFVNKKLALDATQIDEDDKPRNIRMDVVLFKPVEGADFSILNEPYARLIFASLSGCRRFGQYGFRCIQCSGLFGVKFFNGHKDWLSEYLW